MRRLSAIPGVGFITAHAIVAAIGDGPVRPRARLRRLGGHDAAPAFLRRQAARAGLKPAGGRPAAQAVRARRDHPDAQRPPAAGSRHGLAARPHGATADESGDHRPGRQDRKNRLGGGSLTRPASKPRLKAGRSRPTSFRFPSSDRREAAQGAERQATAKWSGPGSGQSDSSSRQPSAWPCLGTRSATPIVASGHEPHRKAEYMTAPVQPPKPLKTPCATGAVHT